MPKTVKITETKLIEVIEKIVSEEIKKSIKEQDETNKIDVSILVDKIKQLNLDKKFQKINTPIEAEEVMRAFLGLFGDKLKDNQIKIALKKIITDL